MGLFETWFPGVLDSGVPQDRDCAGKHFLHRKGATALARRRPVRDESETFENEPGESTGHMRHLVRGSGTSGNNTNKNKTCWVMRRPPISSRSHVRNLARWLRVRSSASSSNTHTHSHAAKQRIGLQRRRRLTSRLVWPVRRSNSFSLSRFEEGVMWCMQQRQSWFQSRTIAVVPTLDGIRGCLRVL
jgi:hypothetical protein